MDELSKWRYGDSFYQYLTACGAVPPLDAAMIRLDGSLIVNLTDLYQYSSDLVNTLTEKPEAEMGEAAAFARELVRGRAPELLDSHPLEVQLVGHPSDTPLREIKSSMIGSLISSSGIVVKRTDTQPKLSQAAYMCGECEYRLLIKQRLQYREEPTVKCPDCNARGRWMFDASRSVYEDTQLIKVQETPESLSGRMPRTFTYEMRGLLCGRVEAGNRVRLTAIIDAATSSKMNMDRTLELYGKCVGVEYLAEDAEDLECTPEEAKAFSEMARSRDMFQAVADSIAPSLYGINEEKKCVAAYLMGGVPKKRNDINIRGDVAALFCGDAGTAKSQILGFAVKASPRGMLTTGKGSSAAGLTAAVVKDKDIGFSLEAGALVLSDKGHCAVDELDKMNEEDRRAMHPAMEQQIVAVNKGGINTTLNARCGIIAAANPKDGRYNPYLTVVQNLNLEAPLLNRFDLIRIMRDLPNEERDASLADHVFKVHGGEEIESPLNIQELRKYVAYCRKHIIPDISPEAEKQIKDYYKALRKASYSSQPDKNNPEIQITPRQLESCIRVTEAVARARLHEVATEDDALTALGIIESSMAQVGVDPSTGERNIDSYMTGKPRGQQQKLELLRTVIWEMQCESLGNACDYNELLGKVTEKGLFRTAELRSLVDHLLTLDLMEPVVGKLKLVKPLNASPQKRGLQAQLQRVLETVGGMAGSEAVRDEELYAELERAHGIGRSEAAKLIGVLMKDGSIFSPRPGVYRRA